MSTHPNMIKRPAHSNCQLAHHTLESRVGVHQWCDTTKSMEYLFGRVIEHSGRRIKIAVDLPRKTVIEVECGAVFPQAAK